MLEHEAEGPSSAGLVINRPLRRGIDPDLAQMLLRGLEPSAVGPSTDASLPPPVDMPLLLKFLKAFGGKGSVYFGGPDDQGEKGIMIHGIADLQGAKEISPGTGIYYGGERDACDAVLSGKCSVLDFRFFVGRKRWEASGPGSSSGLRGQLASGIYKSLACARSVALKQVSGVLPSTLRVHLTAQISSRRTYKRTRSETHLVAVLFSLLRSAWGCQNRCGMRCWS